MIGEYLRALTEPIRMLAEVLQISQIVAAGQYPRTDPRNPSPLQRGRSSRKFLQTIVKCAGILPELNRQARRSKLQMPPTEIVELVIQGGVIKRPKVVEFGIQSFEPMFGSEFHRLGKAGVESQAAEAQNCVEPTLVSRKRSGHRGRKPACG
jgi:hypothetical protein